MNIGDIVIYKGGLWNATCIVVHSLNSGEYKCRTPENMQGTKKHYFTYQPLTNLVRI